MSANPNNPPPTSHRRKPLGIRHHGFRFQHLHRPPRTYLERWSSFDPPRDGTSLSCPAIAQILPFRPPSGAFLLSPPSYPTYPPSRHSFHLDDFAISQITRANGQTFDTVIVGGGLSGLCTGQGLQTRHADTSFLITEARERVGGNITTAEGDKEGQSYLWEEGPNSFQPSDSMLQVAVDSGCADDLVLGDPTAPRFVWWEKKLRATPSGLDAITFDLLTFVGKIRAGLGAVGIVKGGPMPEEEESVEQFIRVRAYVYGRRDSHG